MKEGISLCMIIKNEAQSLERALSSFRGIASEIVIGDTGSTDASKEICRSFDARVHDIQWEDDFSHARNQVIKKASCRWIFVLDADEYLKEGHGQWLLNESRATDVCGYFVPFEDLQDSGYYQSYALPRLFLNDPQILFQNPIHETVEGTLSRFAQKSDMQVRTSQSSVIHTGYQRQAIDAKGKLERNLALLQKLYTKGTTNPFLLLKYGENLSLLSRNDEALRIFLEALNVCDTSKKRGNTIDAELRNEISTGASTLLISQGKLGEAFDLCQKAEKLLPSLSISYNKGLIFWKNNHLPEALLAFQDVIEGRKRGLLDPSGTLPLALNAMGEIHMRQKDLNKAEGFFLKAAEMAPLSLNIWFNLCRLGIEKGDLPKAREHIERAFSIDSRNPAIVKTRELLLKGSS